jgi:TatD DNase family protein
MQISLAIEYKKPLYLHIRNAYQCFAKLLKEETVGGLMNNYNNNACATFQSGQQTLIDYLKKESGHNIVVHCFTGTLIELEYYVNLGCYIGLTGHIFSLPLETVQQMLQMIPLCRLVIETDAPYMGFKGCRDSEDKAKSRKYPNVPAALPKIATFIAEILNVSYEVVCLETTKNALSFFSTDKY